MHNSRTYKVLCIFINGRKKMPKHTKYVTWRRCKVTKTKEHYRVTFPKDFAESDEVKEGKFIYNPFEKRITFFLD